MNGISRLTPSDMDVQVDTINEQITRYDEANVSLEVGNESIHMQIAELRAELRKNERSIRRNAKEADKLRLKRSIFNQAARAIREVDLP
jgi:predicted RNase H-like nuclease (RuvC/YqgF family)